MRRSGVLSLPPQLVFPEATIRAFIYPHRIFFLLQQKLWYVQMLMKWTPAMTSGSVNRCNRGNCLSRSVPNRGLICT
jgi:hypothetical protein